MKSLLRSRIRVAAPVADARLAKNDERDAVTATVRRAEERAFLAGMAHGREQGLADAAGRLEAAAERVAAAHEQALSDLSRTAVELATSIARTLLKRDVAAGNYDLEAMVRETLAEAAVGRNACKVHLNPADVEQLAEIRFRAGTEIQADEGVARGDVQVETSLGLLVREAIGAIDAIEKGLIEEVQ